MASWIGPSLARAWMSGPPSRPSFDFDAFKRAFVSQDVDAWVRRYAEDAEWIEYRDAPPRSPNRIR